MRSFVDPAALSFLRRTTAAEDELLASIAAQSERDGLPRITPEAGRTLQFLIRLLPARRVLEVGTCLGYSTLWMGRGLAPDGDLESFEVDPARAERARAHVEGAGLSDRVRVTVGDAHRLLRERPKAALDLVFVDAEKEGMLDYLQHALRLLRPGGILAADNVFWDGAAFDPRDAHPGAPEVRAFVDAATSSPDLDAVMLPLGDGLLLARRR